ncbi:hypothetical protein A3Q34_06295 [Colwellia sp. PAMC 20917]|nr:hypothetical protein A3Q34_06295 [Colwellia sp. PAMC 20917]
MTTVGFILTVVEFTLMGFEYILHLFQYPFSSCCIYFSIHSRHAAFISVSGLWVVKDEILKQVQDDGVLVHSAEFEFILTEFEFTLMGFEYILNLFQYPFPSC